MLVSLAATGRASANERVVVGSKAFPESWILAEALAALARAGGADAEHRANLGGTEIADAAVRSGTIDAYPEYTGTIREVVLHSPNATVDEVRALLARDGLGMTDSLGFDDSYAIAIAPTRAASAGDGSLRSLSDLAHHPELRAAFSHEFLGRTDGWPRLSALYGIALSEVRGVDHPLAFEALATGNAEVVDVYTTDPQIEHLKLRVLDDDRGFFPRYEAVVVYRLDLEARAPQALEAMRRLVGRVDRAAMARANAEVALEHRGIADAASALLREALGPDAAPVAHERTRVAQILRDSIRHVELVATALAAAVFVGLPIGVAAARRRGFGAFALGGAGILQTIPSLALLALLIPLLGIGVGPAAAALFLYALLPIVQGTYTGIVAIPAPLAESAEALGLTPAAKLMRIELPLASQSILAGVRTSAVIAVGTATIAALVGAGGLGDPILQGIALRSPPLILAGALPAAGLALLVQALFALLERALVPRGLRLRTHEE
jgi:osmoprotectant transport system permease protein